jgi:hypothetical protein
VLALVFIVDNRAMLDAAGLHDAGAQGGSTGNFGTRFLGEGLLACCTEAARDLAICKPPKASERRSPGMLARVGPPMAGPCRAFSSSGRGLLCGRKKLRGPPVVVSPLLALYSKASALYHPIL